MAVPVVEAVTAYDGSTAATTHTVTKPTGTIEGDWLNLSAMSDGARSITQPTGFTVAIEHTEGSVASSAGHVVQNSYKTAGASEPANYSFDLSASDQAVAGLRRISGVDTTTPINASAANGVFSATSIDCPTVTTTVDDCLVLRECCTGLSRTITAPGGAVTADFNIATGGHAGAGGHEPQATAGATGTETYSWSSASRCTGMTVAIAPSAGGATIDMAGSLAAAATLSGTMSVLPPVALSGSLAAVSTFSGSLTVSPPGTVALGGALAAVSTFSGSLSVLPPVALSGSLAAVSALSGTLNVGGTVSLAGSLAATTALTGTLSVTSFPVGNREMSQANAEAAAERVVRPVLLGELAFASGTLYVTNAPFTVPYEGNDYLGVGHFGDISPVEEGAELRAYALALTLNGIPLALISTALTEHYQGRDCTISELLLDADLQAVSTATVLFRGRMDTMRIALGETASIELTAESRLADWERPRVLRYNNATQQQRFPNDTGFKYVAQLADKQIVWPASGFFAQPQFQ